VAVSDETCEHWERDRYCGSTDQVHVYVSGARCPLHTPARVNGRDDIVPDPELTMDALMRKAGRAGHSLQNDSAVLDQNAIASSTGRRPKSKAEYDLAKDEIKRRKGKR
jgi:hypothetical protein